VGGLRHHSSHIYSFSITRRTLSVTQTRIVLLKMMTTTQTTTTRATMMRSLCSYSGKSSRRSLLTTTTTTERNKDDCRRTRRKNNIGGVRTEAMARGKRKGIADIIGEEIDGQEKKKKEPQQKMKIRSEGKKMADEFNNKGKIPNGFLKILNLQDFDEKKNIKAVTLANGNFCVVRVGELIYVCDCNSTAYKYPLIDGELFNGPGGASIRSPFDGTSYDLTTGKVIEWCPQDTLPRKMLGKLKENATPVDLGVYPVIVDEQGDIYASFVQ
jgi:nitrite reductase/ring-hydroxylating ferredoxin subunit